MAGASQNFIHGYMTAALRASIDRDGKYLSDTYGVSDITAETRAKMQWDCHSFYSSNAEAINFFGAPGGGHSGGTDGKAGYDFWLTRCGHTAGFRDGDWPEPQATQLEEAAKAFGEVELRVRDDGKIHAILAVPMDWQAAE